MTTRRLWNADRGTGLSRAKIFEAYEDWIVERIQGGWDGYLLTFLFKPLPGSAKSIAAQMEDEVHAAYRKMLHYIIRDARKTPLDEFPMWIGSPDWPVPKRVRTALSDVAANDGRHVHAIAMIPPNTRLKIPLDAHINAHQAKIADGRSKLIRLHAVPIEQTPRKAAGYVLKSLARYRVSEGDVLLLPKAVSELERD